MSSTTRRHLRTALGTGLVGALLLSGCATRTAGTASVGTAGPGVASVSSPSAPAAPETTIAGSSAPVTDAEVADVCNGYSQLLASFALRPSDPAKGYQWEWTIRAGEAGVLRLWSPDSTATWDFEVPADQSRDEQLCQDLLDLESVDEPVEGNNKRAWVSFTTQDSRTSKFELTQEHAAGFEDLVLDRLPADVFTEMNNTLIQWQEQNPGTPATSGETPAPTSAQTTAADTAAPEPSTSSSVPKELEDHANQCEQLVLATVTFTPTGDDKMGVELLFDTEQGSATLQMGQASTSIDFAPRDGADPVLLCRMLIKDSEENGHDGKDEFGAIGTVYIETNHPDFPKVFQGPLAFPSVTMANLITAVVPQDAQQEMNRFFEENSG